jgi:AraC-like DNA-binding protein
MAMATLYIRNMVCNRCKMVVKSELEKLGHHALGIELGEVTLPEELSKGQKAEIDKALQAVGFSLIDDKKSRLIEKTKTLIVELVHQNNSELKTNLSDFLSARLDTDYKYITTLFSEVEGTTIEKYFIAQKIERVKELLVYGELSLSEIAYQLNYSSVAHLSAQFKKVTGLTPSHFKKIGSQRRSPLDELKLL